MIAYHEVMLGFEIPDYLEGEGIVQKAAPRSRIRTRPSPAEHRSLVFIVNKARRRSSSAEALCKKAADELPWSDNGRNPSRNHGRGRVVLRKEFCTCAAPPISWLILFLSAEGDLYVAHLA